MKALFPFFLLMILFSGCSKNDSAGVGGNGASGDYQPVIANSSWLYKQVFSHAHESESKIICTDQKKTINGINFTVYKIEASNTGVEQLIGKSGNNYYTNITGITSTGTTDDLIFLYLNDREKKGYKWGYDAGETNGMKAKLEGEIIDKGFKLHVGGIEYQDVIHTKLDLKFIVEGFGTVEYGTYNFYSARGIGIIKIDYLVTASGIQLGSSTDLIEFKAKN